MQTFTSSPPIPMALLRASETGRVVDVDGAPDFVTRLDEMGLRIGTQVRMLQPGEPCLIALDDQRLSFRGGDLFHVLVEVEH